MEFNTPLSICVFVCFCSKQNQLWMEGIEFYKGCPYNKAPPYEYGIYSIKQREMFKSTNGNGVQNVPKGKHTIVALFSQWVKYNAMPIKTDEHNLNFTENTNIQIAKLKDRVQNISQKVDTMKLNDSHAAATKTLPVSVSITNREFLHRDENKNTAAAATLPCSLTVGVSTRRKVIAPTPADIDNNNDHFDKNVTNPTTQGDKLNQIKAMRRRHTRMAANMSPVSTGL